MGGTALFAKVTDVTPVNPLFSKCKINVMYTGQNRNGSFISKEVVENAIPTIANIPIIGEFVQSKEDFGGHGGKIIISDQGIEYVKTTKPYGVVPESATYSWEEIEEDGVTHEYLVVDGAYLWTGRYEEASQVVEKGKGQSMEVEFTSGKFDKGKNLYVVEEMIFSALCILGDDIEPCFEGASISESFSNKEEWAEAFNAEWIQMLKELAEFTLQENKEGGNSVPDVTTTNEFTWSSEQLEGELRRLLYANKYEDRWGWECPAFWFVDYLPDQNVVIGSDDCNNYLVGMSYTVEGDLVTIDFDSVKRWKVEYVPMSINVDGDGDSDDGITFSLFTKEQMEHRLMTEMAKKSQDDNKDNDDDNQDDNDDAPNGDMTTNDTDNDNDDDSNDNTDDDNEPNGDHAITTDNGNGGQGENSQNTPEDQSVAVTEDQYSLLQAEVEALRKFKEDTLTEQRLNAENELFAKFAGQLTEEEISGIREKSSECTLEQLETNIFALIGKKATQGQFSVNNGGKKDPIRVATFNDTPVVNKSDKPYAHLIIQKGRK